MNNEHANRGDRARRAGHDAGNRSMWANSMKTLRIIIEATFEVETLEHLSQATETIDEALEKLREVGEITKQDFSMLNAVFGLDDATRKKGEARQ